MGACCFKPVVSEDAVEVTPGAPRASRGAARSGASDGTASAASPVLTIDALLCPGARIAMVLLALRACALQPWVVLTRSHVCCCCSAGARQQETLPEGACVDSRAADDKRAAALKTR
jgi:hypothetical protein